MSVDTGISPTQDERSEQSVRPNTKLAIVKEQLIKNPKVYFAGETHEYHSGAPDYGYWSETVNIIVAPQIPIFDINKLNAFMLGMVDLKPTNGDLATMWQEDGIHLGRLYYDEAIGTRRRIIIDEIESDEPETIQRAGKTMGRSEDESIKELKRRTWVRVYPDSISAQEVQDYHDALKKGTMQPIANYYSEHWLNGKQVERLKAFHRKEPLNTIKGILLKK